MIYTSLFAVVPHTSGWSLGVGLVMVSCNLFAIAIGRYAIQQKGMGGKLPVELPDPFGNEFGIPELLATTSFGHILGAGMILGLSSAGIL